MQLTSKIGLLFSCLLLASCTWFHERYTDEEAVAAILAADGSGSGLDADLLDGKDSSEFVLTTEDKWVDEAGDTMTGPLVVENNVTAQDYFYTPAKRGHKGVAGAVFIPSKTRNTAWITSENGYGYLNADPWIPSQGLTLCNDECLVRVTPLSGAVGLRANVVLPEKAKVTTFTCYWLDKSTDPVANYNFKLMRKQWFQVGATPMATVSGSTNALAPDNSVRHTTTNDINEPIINTSISSYYISGNWSVNGMGDAVRFYGCLVGYDVTKAGPA
jgi:hypothetical protein